MFKNASNELLTSPQPPKIEPLLWKNPIATSRPTQNSKSEVQQSVHVGVKREKIGAKRRDRRLQSITITKHSLNPTSGEVQHRCVSGPSEI